MTGVARAKHYPQPRASADVLAELRAERCEHGDVLTVPPRCPLCRFAEPEPDPPDDPPAAPTPRRARPPVAEYVEDDPRTTAWWDR